MSDNDRRDDPWANWRKPATPAAEAEPPRAEAPADAAASAEAETPVGRASGTLGVRKTVKAVKADARPSKPSTSRPTGGKPAASREGRPAERDGPRPGKPGGKPAANRGDQVWRKPDGEGRSRGGAATREAAPQRENPWAKAVRREAPPVKPAVVSPQPVGEAPSGVRLSKVMSERGLCSRREADLWIERGWVYVNGEQVSELGSRIDPEAEISVSKEAVKDQAKAVTILLHKPVGYVSGQPEPGSVPAVTLVTPEAQVVQSGDPDFKPWMLRGLAPAGRLDVDSTGLLVLTSDGRVAKRLIGEHSDTEKEYLVRVSGTLIQGGLELLRHGLELDGKALRPAWVKQLNEDQLHFILKEGKKRQIRRMCELVGLRVIGLKRVRIGRIRLGDLPLGQWRFLRADEAF